MKFFKSKMPIILCLCITVICCVLAFTACKGENGKSAYEIWLDNGHTGTESDFLEWLKGDNGNVNESLQYQAIKENGVIIGYSVCGYGNVSDTDIVIPSTYREKPVLSISDYAFKFSSDDYDRGRVVTSITIPDSVNSIGRQAFYECSSLTSINIPGSITTIGERAFGQCRSLTKITIPDSVASMGNEAFFYCISLTIYCKAEKQPNGWNKNWNSENCPVVWGYQGN